MIAYTFKYKNKMPRNLTLAYDDFHECDSSECCYTGNNCVESGLPIFETIDQLLHALTFLDWSFIHSSSTGDEYVHTSYSQSNIFRPAMMRVMNADTVEGKLFELKKVNITISKIEVKLT